LVFVALVPLEIVQGWARDSAIGSRRSRRGVPPSSG